VEYLLKTSIKILKVPPLTTVPTQTFHRSTLIHPSHWETLLLHNLVNKHVTTTSLRLMFCFQINS